MFSIPTLATYLTFFKRISLIFTLYTLKLALYTCFLNISFSELFNLPIGALWTAVVGEWELDSGGRGCARLPVEKVILHERFNNYVHDIGEPVTIPHRFS